jgi:hypothetical protein
MRRQHRSVSIDALKCLISMTAAPEVMGVGESRKNPG